MYILLTKLENSNEYWMLVVIEDSVINEILNILDKKMRTRNYMAWRMWWVHVSYIRQFIWLNLKKRTTTICIKIHLIQVKQKRTIRNLEKRKETEVYVLCFCIKLCFLFIYIWRGIVQKKFQFSIRECWLQPIWNNATAICCRCIESTARWAPAMRVYMYKA